MGAACWRPAPTSISCSCCPTSARPRREKIVETMLYVLWDLRQKVGHATRSVDECLQQAKADMTVRTSLLEARFILGDRALFDNLWEPLRQGNRRPHRARIRRRQARRTRQPPEAHGRLALSRSSPTSRRARAACAISTRCSGSPNTSIGCATPANSSPPACSRARELSLFRRCEEFLWAVRCHLHFLDRPARGAPELRFAAADRRRLGYAAARRP